MGKKESKYTRLHFEIRLDGKPQNPKKYLPALKY
jgi:murein DD-endopeptidase MepM/ murein hydrolase activator NlpD